MCISCEDQALCCGLWFKDYTILVDNALSFQGASLSYTFRRLLQHCMSLAALEGVGQDLSSGF